MSKNQLLAAITDTIKNKIDVVAEGGDLLWSAAVDSEALKEVPLVSAVYKAYEINNRLQANRLRRNCIAFLEACRGTDLSARCAAMDSLAADQKSFEDFSDSLLQILCESFKPVKASITGRLLSAFIDGNLRYEEFDRLLHIVESASIPALKALQSFCRGNGGSRSYHGEPHEEPMISSLGVGSRYGTNFQVSTDGIYLFNFAVDHVNFNV